MYSWACCRFSIYVCTAAERQYALEVWRLLDTQGTLIPIDQRKKRLVNVPAGAKKTMLHSLGVVNVQAAAQHSRLMSDARDMGAAPGGSHGLMRHR